MIPQTQLTAIVAYDSKRGIGKDGNIPWNIPGDMKHFKSTTMGNIVIMGRKTWDSLPKKPLEGRINIVISSKQSSIPKAIVTPDPVSALILARQIAKYNILDIFVIGGQSIYEAYKDEFTQIIATEINGDYDVDTFFPLIPGNWNKDNCKSRGVENKSDSFQYSQYTKIS